MTKKKPHSKGKKDDTVTLAPLDFEKALEGLLQVKPATNKEVALKPKKKRTVKSKKK